jgi:hypothetical protein
MSSPDKLTKIIRTLSWIVRLLSIPLCIATFSIGIYLDLTKNNIDNRGGPIPLVYLAVSPTLYQVSC